MKEVHHRFRKVHCFDGRLSTAMSPLVIESVHKLQDLQRVADTEGNYQCIPWVDLLAELLLPWRGSSEELAHLPLDLMRCCGDKEFLKRHVPAAIDELRTLSAELPCGGGRRARGSPTTWSNVVASL